MFNKNIIKFVTDDALLYEKRPVAPSLSYAPAWWKSLDKDFVTDNGWISSTVKTCPGFVDLYKNSFALPIDRQMQIQERDGRILWIPEDAGESHADFQTNDFFKNDFYHLKISLNYSICTGKNNKDKFLITNNFWGDRKNIHVLNGVIQPSAPFMIRINMFIPKGFGMLTFEHGDILAHIIPLSGKKYRIKREFLFGEKFNEYHKASLVISKGFRTTVLRRDLNKYVGDR